MGILNNDPSITLSYKGKNASQKKILLLEERAADSPHASSLHVPLILLYFLQDVSAVVPKAASLLCYEYGVMLHKEWACLKQLLLNVFYKQFRKVT